MTHLDVARYNKGVSKYRKGDICWINNLEFRNSIIRCKGRPVLILSVKNGIARCRRCTSQTSTFRDRRVIEDLFETGLLKTTYVDMEVVEYPVDRMGKVIGHLSKNDCARLCD